MAPEEFVHSQVDTPDGSSVAVYVRSSSNDEPPLVAIPGLDMTATSWFEVAAMIDRPVAVIEPRGSGLSSGVVDVVTGHDFASDVLAVMDSQNWARAHIAGVSMGGMIAQHTAIRSPRRVASLSLVCTYARPGPWGALAWKLRQKLLSEEDPYAQRLAAAMLLTSPSAVEATPEVVDLLLALWESAPNDPKSYAAQMNFCAQHDVLEALADLSVPALVVSGEWDLLCTTGAGAELSAALSGQHLVFEGASHVLSNEQPGRLADALRDHMTSADRKAGIAA